MLLWTSIVKSLRLHLDPTIEYITTLHDPALPVHLPLYSIQIVRRMFHHVVYLDMFDAYINGKDAAHPIFVFPLGE